MDVIDAIYQRHAVRAYTAQPVERATVERLLWAAGKAPSAMNAQPWGFAVIQDRALLADLSRRAKAAFLDVDRNDARMLQLREIMASPEFDIFYGAGTLVVICAASGHPTAAEDCCLAGQNLMLAAHGLGLGTCPIGLARAFLNLPAVKAELGIPPEFSPVLPIIVGHASGSAAGTSREPPRILCWK